MESTFNYCENVWRHICFYRKPRDSSPPNKLSFNRENQRKRKPTGSVANASEFDSGLKFKRKKKMELEWAIELVERDVGPWLLTERRTPRVRGIYVWNFNVDDVWMAIRFRYKFEMTLLSTWTKKVRLILLYDCTDSFLLVE